MRDTSRPRIGFIGAGVVGTALAVALADADYPVAAVHSRDLARRDELVRSLPAARSASTRQEVAELCDLVFLTVSDDALADVAASIRWPRGVAAITTHGAASLDVLRAVQDQGASVGVFHPLKSFATATQSRRFAAGTAVRIDASNEALRDTLTRMAEALGGRPLFVAGDPTLYHAGAVLASNALVTLMDLAAELWTHVGIPKDEAVRALLPLVRGTVDNLDRVGSPRALTGPIARGDAGTLARHLETLGRIAPATLPVYKELARRTIPVALAKGTLAAEAAERLLRLLDATEEGGSCARDDR
ncbi:MAG: Rossmann-like and DUF2520 domain-containing protein [Candidatus Bipolaricaulota bacterium]